MATTEKTSTPEAAAIAAARSHGRGGAGNMSSKPAAAVDAASLQTPTIKSALYTTGRGGTGNMAQNNPNDPAATRAAQDVDAPPAHNREIKGTYHWGRGGEGNMMTVGGKDTQQQQRSASPITDGRPPNSRNASSNSAKRRTGSFQAAMEKGREIFGLNAKKDAAAAQNESAIE